MKITKSKLEELGFIGNGGKNYFRKKVSTELMLVVNFTLHCCYFEYCAECELESGVLKINTNEDLETFLKFFQTRS